MRGVARRLEPIVLAVLAVGAGACSRTGDGGSSGAGLQNTIPPIVVVSIDTLRSDHLPAYGYAEVDTPAIDRLVEDAILFERAYSPVPLTLPAHASLFSGLLPPSHGVRDNAGYRLGGDISTLAEVLSGHGYATAATVSSFTLRAETGIDQGFELYEDGFVAGQRQTIGEIQRSGGATLAAALPWLRAVGDDPFFFFLHLYEPHTPYEPPEPFAGRYASAYDGEIAAADAVLETLLAELEALDVYERSVLVLLSDHGEGLGDHGEEEHGILLYREALQVPLIVKLPGSVRGGSRVSTPVQITDVTATLLELAGVKNPPEVEGSSLLDPPARSRALYGETYHPRLRFGWSALRSMIQGRHHYIEGPNPELYDLDADPQERENVLRRERRIFADLRDRLAEIDSRLELPFAESAETQHALAALGYLGSSVADAEQDGPDPRSQLHTLEPLREGIDALRRGEYSLAEARLRHALELNTELLDAWQFLGLALARQGRSAEAFEAYEEAFRRSNGSPLLAEPMAEAALGAGKLREAAVLLRAALEQAPDRLELRFLLTRTLLMSRRFEEALQASEEALRRAPESADAHYQRGAVRMAMRDLGAEADLRRALELEPNHVAALSDLGVLLMALERWDEARLLLTRVVELQPENEMAREHLRQLDRLGS